ncbi:putative Partition protein ParB-like protein [Listeria aquatica FSL S10-1188]|uniref:Putative Partition protein ParB-like protein n=1 Tax=Listeria aquatica FSL S10-1188 TaxID=1265818 RepID=W7B412_9LIST|nr:putative Partition protein ParB-like protein [Listeria aquatica FSL S10-1188]
MAKGLGKGINALFNTVDTDEETIVSIALDKVDANPFQPRKNFDKKAIQELTDSIKIHGVLQPVILREKKDRYEIVVGERRCRASVQAGLKEIPAVVRTLNDQEMMELSVIENLQREDLSALEEAESYDFLNEKLKINASETCRTRREKSSICG